MKSYKYIPFSILLICIFTIMISCSRMDDYNDFLDGKELVYPGKVDSVKIHSGKNRIAISWLLTSDPKITKAVVYWNNMADSVVVPINRTEGVDSIGVIIPNLQIGVYNFIIYTYDKDNNKSVPVTISGRVFGDDYERTLINRPINSAYRWNNEVPLFIAWDKLDPTSSNVAVGAKITYKDGNGNNHSETVSFRSSNDTSMLILPENLSSTQIIEFSTMIKPDSVALDTFYAPKERLIYSMIAVNAIVINEDVAGKVNVLPANSAINKSNLTFTKTINIARQSLDLKLAYTVDLQLSSTGIPAGTTAMNLSDVTMTTTDGIPVTKLTVPAGQSTIKLNFTMPKSMLDANSRKKMAFKVNLSNLTTSKFIVDDVFLSTSIVVDEAEFLKINDVTTTYFKNPGGEPPFFIRDDAGSPDRWGTAKDWIANAAALNIGGKGGIDTPNGNNYLNFFKYFNSTPAILDGKLYQTFTLPKGKFEFAVDRNDSDIKAGNSIYYVVAEGSTLPNTSDVASSIAYAPYTASKVNFELTSQKTVSIGLLAYLSDDGQEYRAKGVKLYQYVGAFD